MTDHDTQQGHFENGLAAAYVDGRLAAVELARVEAHLAECAECRQEVVAVRRLLRSRSRRWAWPAMAGLGVAATLLLILSRPGDQSRPGGPPLRGDGSEPRDAPVALAPAPNVTVSPESIGFAWRGAAGAVSYRLTLTDERGDVVWSSQTPDTTVVLPGSVRLTNGRAYYWYVDALLPDARSTTTGVKEFRVGP
jgi:anti-sigma factor RsiW